MRGGDEDWTTAGKRGIESGYVRVLVDTPRNKPKVFLDIPVGSDAQVKNGPLKAALQSVRSSLGTKSPACSHQNVYWLACDSRQPASVTDAVAEVLPLASDEEMTSLYELIIPQAVLCYHHPHPSRALQLVLRRGSPAQQKSLIDCLKGHVVRFSCSTVACHSLSVAFSVASQENRYELAWELEKGLSAGKLDEKDSLSLVLASAMEHLPSPSIPTAFSMTLDRLEVLCSLPQARSTVIAFLNAAGDGAIIKAAHLLAPQIASLINQKPEGKERRSIVKHLFSAVGRLWQGRAEAAEQCLGSITKMQYQGILHEHVSNQDFILALKELNDACNSSQRTRLLESLQSVLRDLRMIQDVSGREHGRSFSSLEDLVEGFFTQQQLASEEKKSNGSLTWQQQLAAEILPKEKEEKKKAKEPDSWTLVSAEKKAVEAAIQASLCPAVHEKQILARSDFGQSNASSEGGEKSRQNVDRSSPLQEEPQVQGQKLEEPAPVRSADDHESEPNSSESKFTQYFHSPAAVPVPVPVPPPAMPTSLAEEKDLSKDLFSLLLGPGGGQSKPQNTSTSLHSFAQQPSLNFPPPPTSPPPPPPQSSFSALPSLDQHSRQINQATMQHLSFAAYPQGSSQTLKPLTYPPSFELSTLDEAMKMQQSSMIQQLQQQQSQALSMQQTGALQHQMNPLHNPPPPILLLYPVPIPVVLVQHIQHTQLSHSSFLPSIVYNAQQQSTLSFAHPSTLTTPSTAFNSLLTTSSSSINPAQAHHSNVSNPYNPFQQR